MTPKISFIVSAYDRPRQLACVLASLQVQTFENIEVVVVDNQRDYAVRHENETRVRNMVDRRMRYAACECAHCYYSSEQGASLVCGEWLCFPSDDNYYVPAFAELMLKAAELTEGNEGVGFVYCDMVYDPRLHGVYSVVDVRPQVNNVDKGGFLIRRELFLEVGGFPDKENGVVCDGLLIEELVRRGVRGVKAPGVLWVHN